MKNYSPTTAQNVRFLKVLMLFVLFIVSGQKSFGQSFRTPTFTGALADFNAAERFTSVDPNVTYAITFDATYMYFGVFRTSGTFGGTDNFAIYLDTDPRNTLASGNGSTAGRVFNGVTPTLPFNADYVSATEQGYTDPLQRFSGGWGSTGITPTTFTSTTCREVRISLADLGNPASVYATMWMGFAGGIFANAPGTAVATSATPTITGYFGSFPVYKASITPVTFRAQNTGTANGGGTAISNLTVNTGSTLTAGDYGDITLTNASTYTLSANTSFTGTLTIGSGTANATRVGLSTFTLFAGGRGIGGTAGQLSVNGSSGAVFTTGAGGTFSFLGAGDISGANIATTPLFPFNSSVTLGGAVNFGTVGLAASQSGIGGVLQINANGSVITNAPTYGLNSTLVYNTSGTYTTGLEWTTNSATAKGVPRAVTIQNNTALNFGTSVAYRQANGLVTIGSGSTLTLSSVSGGDLRIAAGLTNSNATINVGLNTNGRAVQTMGGGNYIKNGVTGGTDSLDFLIIGSTGTLILASNTNLNLTNTNPSGCLQFIADGILNMGGNNTISIVSGGTVGGTTLGTISGQSPTTCILNLAGTTTWNTGGAITVSTNVGIQVNAGLTISTAGRLRAGYLQINPGGFIGGANPVVYNGTSTLVYNHNTGTYGVQALEFPATSGPSNLTINANGTSTGISFATNNITTRTLSGTLTLNQNLVLSGTGPAALTTLNTIANATSTVSGTGNFTHSASGSFTTANTNGINGTLTTGGTITLPTTTSFTFNNATTSQVTGTLLPATIAALTINNATASTGTTISNNTLTISGLTTLTAGALILPTAASNLVTFTGNISTPTSGGTITGSTTSNISTAASIAGTANGLFFTSGGQNIGNWTHTTATNFGSTAAGINSALTINGVFSTTAISPFIYVGPLGNITFTSGSSFVDNGSSPGTSFRQTTATGGSFTLASGASFTTANTGGLNATSAAGAVQTTNRTFNGGANYTFNNSTVTQVIGDALDATVAAGKTGPITGNVTILNNIPFSGVTLNAATTITVNTPGTFNIGVASSSSAILTALADSVINGTGTINMFGVASATGGSLLRTANPLGVNGTFQTTTTNLTNGANNNTSFLFNGANTGQVTGTLMPTTVSNLTTGNNSASSASSPAVLLTQSTVVNGSFGLTVGHFSINGQTLTLNGVISMTSPFQSLCGSATSNLIIGGSGAISANGLMAPSPANVLNNFTMNRTGTFVNLAASTIVEGTFNLTNGEVRFPFTATLNGPINITSGTVTGSGGPLVIGGSGAISGALSTISAPLTFTGITMNRTGETLTLGSNTTVSNATGVTLTAGYIALGNFNLTNTTNGNTLGTGSTASHIVATGSGKAFMSFATGATAIRTFPIGDGTNYTPATLTFSGNTVAGTVGANVTDAAHPAYDNSGAQTDYISRFWSFTSTGLTNYTYSSTFTYVPSDINGTQTNMKLNRYTGGTWIEDATSAAASNVLTSTTGLTQANGLLNGSDFTGRLDIAILPTGYYWNGASNVANPAAGGTGNWSDTNNWRIGYTGAQATWADANPAYISGTAGTITLSTSVAPSSTTLQTTGYTLATSGVSGITLSGDVALGSNSITLAPITGADLTVSGIVGGTGSITQNGAGATTLSGTNTYSGNTNINNGVLSISADANLGAAPGGATAGKLNLNTGTLAITNGFTLNGNRGMALTNANSFDIASGQTLTYGGITAGTGSLIKTGAGILSLTTATSTYSGGTTINAGTITVDGPNRIGGASGDLTINNGTFQLTSSNINSARNIVFGNSTSTFDIASGITYTSNSGSIFSGSGILNKAGAGTLLFPSANAGNHTYNGLHILAGTVQMNKELDLGTLPGAVNATYITLGGGTLSAQTGVTINSNRGITLTSSTSSAIDVASSQTVTYGGIITGAGNINKTSAGSLVLSGINTNTGTTTISGGTLNLTGSLSSSSAVSIASGATLSGTGTAAGTVSNSGILSPAGSASIGTFNTGSQTWNNAGAYAIDLNNVTGSAGTINDLLAITGSLTTSGTITIPLTGTITGFSYSTAASWTIATTTTGITNGATYSISTTGIANDFGSGVFSVSVSGNNLVLNFTPGEATITFSTSAGTATGLVASTNNVIYRVNLAVTGNDTTFTGSTFATTGTYTASDIATNGIKFWYSTNATFSTGTASQIGSSITSSGNAETLAFTSGISQALVSGSTYYLYVTVDYNAGATVNNTIRIAATTLTNYTFGTTVTRAGTSGVGTTQMITGYTNRVWSGTGASATWLSTANWSTTAVPSATEIARFAAATSGGNTVGINMNTAGGSQIVGAIEFTNTRANSMTIGNNSGADGILTINGTVLNAVANVIIRNNSSQLLTLQNNVSGSSAMGVALGNATNNIIAIDGAGGVTISSIISGGSNRLTKNGSGAGALVLSNANTFSGGVTLNSGLLSINGTSALGTGTFTINGGTINGTNGNYSHANALAIGGDFSFSGIDQISFTNTATPVELGTSITRTINHNSINFLALSSTLNGTGTTLAINSNNTGFVALSGTSNFTGGITVTSSSSGGLSFAAATAVPTTGTITVNNGGVLRFPLAGTYGTTGQSIVLNPNQTTNGAILAPLGAINTIGRDIAINADSKIEVLNASGFLTLSGIISGSGKLIKSGLGVLTLTGSSNTFSGDVQVDGGTFRVSTNNALPTNKNVIVNTGGIFRVNTSIAQTIQNLDLSGGGNLEIFAGATLTITGTYTPGNGTINNLGTIILNGAAAQSFPGINTVVNNGTTNTLTNLIINNSNGVSLDKSFTVVGTLTLTNGALTVGSSNTLTIANGRSITATSGNIATGTSGGTIAFAGTGTVSGTVTFNNVTVAGGVNFGTASTIGTNGTLQLNSGGFVTTNAPTYNSTSTLIYNNTGTYGRGLEWSTASGAGYPGNVQVSNNTTINYPNTGSSPFSSNLAIAGNLTVDAGSSVFMDFGGNANKSGMLTVTGDITLNGSLSLGNAAGGDIKVGGNWTRSATGTFSPNGRAVFFTGLGTNIINSVGGASFDYLVSEKTGGTLQLGSNLAVNAPNGGNGISLRAAANFNLSGNILNLTNAVASNIQADGAGVNFTGSGTINFGGATKTVTQINSGTVVFGSDIALVTSAFGGINFGNGLSTVNGSLQINTDGFVDTNAPIYGTASSLIYNTGTSFNRSVEWGNTSGAGFANNVFIQNGTTVNLSTASPVATRGNLVIGNVTAGTLNFNSRTDAATIGGNIVIGDGATGSGTLTLSSANGGDIYVAGNWTRAANGTFTPNGRAVFFNGTGTSVITASSPSVEVFDYLAIQKSSGSAQIGATTDITINTSVGDVLQLLDAGALDLNGRTLTLNNAGGNILTNGGARNITSTVAGGTIAVTAAKAVNDLSTGTLVTDENVRWLLTAGMNFGTNKTTVNGTLQLNSGGSVVTNPPSYASTSTLLYNIGTTVARGLEFSATSGPGYPGNVKIQNSTVLDFDANAVASGLAGNLILGDAIGNTPGSLFMDASTATLTVAGNVVNGENTSGTSTLTLSTATGGNLTVNGNITVTNGNAINAPANAVITLGGIITNSGTGTTTFQNGASLFQTGTGTNVGAIRYLRNTTPTTTNFTFTYWGASVANQLLSGIWMSPNLADTFYTWNNTTNSWVGLPSNTAMTPGVGYIARARIGGTGTDYSGTNTYTANTPWTARFNGVPNNANIPVTVTQSSNILTGNLLANPYPSAIDISAFRLDPDNSELTGNFYFWTNNTPITNNTYNASDYAIFNVALNAAVTTSGATPAPDQFVDAGQGFFADGSSNGTVIFKNSHRVAGNNNAFYRTNQNSSAETTLESSKIWLNLTNTQGLFKQQLLTYTQGATNGYDATLDARTFDGNDYVDFYSIIPADKLTIQSRAVPFATTDVVPLGFKTTVAGTYKIAIDRKDGLFNTQTVYLQDNLLNIDHNLSLAPYNFSTAAGTFNTRFVLKYNSTFLGIDNPNATTNFLNVYKNNSAIVVNSTKEKLDRVVIYDLLGRKVFEKNNLDTNEFTAKNITENEQVLIVKVHLKNGTIHSVKVVY